MDLAVRGGCRIGAAGSDAAAGGYWRVDFDLSLEREVAAQLGRRGFAVWNVDYAAADQAFPATFEDVAAALDHLRGSQYADRLNLDRVAVVGHSAGGHLALWLASRGSLPAGAPGEPGADAVPVQIGVAQAPVADLVAAARMNLGGGAAQDLLDGTPEEVPQRYAQVRRRRCCPSRVSGCCWCTGRPTTWCRCPRGRRTLRRRARSPISSSWTASATRSTWIPLRRR